MSTFADEVAALRGTRPATFKDLITYPAFSKLLDRADRELLLGTGSASSR